MSEDYGYENYQEMKDANEAYSSKVDPVEAYKAELRKEIKTGVEKGELPDNMLQLLEGDK